MKYSSNTDNFAKIGNNCPPHLKAMKECMALLGIAHTI